MADIVKQMLAKPIQLADQVTKVADEANSFKQDCADIKSKTEKLAALLRQAARASNDLYQRPTKRIIEDIEQVLQKALSIVSKCRANGLVKRVFTIIPAAAFRKMTSLLENSIGDVSWLLRVSANERGDEYLGLPPIAANEPILCLIWEQIAILYTGSLDERSDAAASLVSLAQDNDRYGKLIITEGGVGPLLKLLKEGKLEGQENAAKAIGLLGCDPESIEHMVHAGVCSVFAKILKEGPMKVQSVVAWAVAELAGHYPKCQDLFQQHNIVRLLVSHLAFDTVQEHSKYAIVSKATSIHAVVLASNNNSNVNKANEDDGRIRVPHPLGNNKSNQIHNVITTTMSMKGLTKTSQENVVNGVNQTLNQLSKINGTNNVKQNHLQHQHQNSVCSTGTSNKGRENEDPATKAYMKAMAARALWKLAKGNSSICRSITESRALLCFAVLLEKGTDDVKYNSSMAIMEITAVAEQDADLRRSAFKPNTTACKAVVDQLLRIIKKGDSELLIPCINAIGNLARTFRATETRIISPLVKLLDEREPGISKEAALALTKFACSNNYLHKDHSKAIINAGGTKHLIQLVYFGEQNVQSPALLLLCYIALHVPDSEVLAQSEVLTVLEWASKHAYLSQHEKVERLLQEANSRLELYQSRGSRGFH